MRIRITIDDIGTNDMSVIKPLIIERLKNRLNAMSVNDFNELFYVKIHETTTRDGFENGDPCPHFMVLSQTFLTPMEANDPRTI